MARTALWYLVSDTPEIRGKVAYSRGNSHCRDHCEGELGGAVDRAITSGG